jgi:hypothetical protein
MNFETLSVERHLPKSVWFRSRKATKKAGAKPQYNDLQFDLVKTEKDKYVWRRGIIEFALHVPFVNQTEDWHIVRR